MKPAYSSAKNLFISGKVVLYNTLKIIYKESMGYESK